MEQKEFMLVQAQVLKIEKDLLKNTYLCYNEIGELFNKKPSVISQYAKAGLIHPVQQGPKKLVRMEEVYELEVYLHAAKYYGCSYVACKMLGGLLKNSKIEPQNYMNTIKNLENKLLSPEEVRKHVNSYTNRGIFQKKKNKESKISI